MRYDDPPPVSATVSGDGAPGEPPAPPGRALSPSQARVLLVAVFVIAACGLLYELIVGTLSSYLLGNSVLHFSLTIGGFMTAMGIGSLLSRHVERHLLAWFVGVELAVGLAGGASAALLYAAYTYTPLYHVAMGALVLAIGGLVGMEIPLVTRLLGGREALKDTLANVLAFDYLGALLAAVLFPLVLMPALGVLRTAFVTGALNVAVVAVCLHAFRHELAPRRWPAVITGGLAALLLLGAVGAARLTARFETRLYDDPVIYAEQSPYQRLVLTRRGTDLRLFLDGGLQFSSVDEHRYHEALVHPALAATASREHVLVLGGGDGLAVREVLRYADVRRVTVVDLDRAVTDLARTHPALRALNGDAFADPRVTIVSADAQAFLAETTDRFGVVLIDLPDPNHESLAKLYSRSFYDLVGQRLAVGGAVAAQATSPYFAREAYWSIVGTAEAAGLAPLPYHVYVPSFGDWGFFLGGPHRRDLGSPVFPGGLRYLTPELFAAARLFDGDTDRVPVQTSTLDDPAVLRYYERGWKRWQ